MQSRLERPRRVITFDLDGVICRPPLGVNVGISRSLAIPQLPSTLPVRPPDAGKGPRRTFGQLLQVLRYLGRRPMPDARIGLLAVRELRRPLLVTARSALTLPFIEAWLRRNDLRDCFDAIYANDTGLRSAQFKLYRVQTLEAAEHVDDDGATAYYLASHGLARIYLRDWPRNRGLPYPPAVQVIRSILEVAEDLAQRD